MRRGRPGSRPGAGTFRAPRGAGWGRAAVVKTVMGPHQLAKLIDAHAAPLTLYARQWCPAPEDVVQEAFVKLAAFGTPPGNVVGWLYKVVRNAAISAGRAARRRQRHEAAAAARRPDWFLPTDGLALDARAAAAALEALPDEQRECIVAHLWGGLTFEQIGELTDVSSSTAHRRYLAALDALRRRLRVSCPRTT
jgi:RNA polymerase sigma factor (sigma-70 family)